MRVCLCVCVCVYLCMCVPCNAGNKKSKVRATGQTSHAQKVSRGETALMKQH